MFLDSVSGDLFTFEFDELQWVPFGNTGIHSTRTLDELPQNKKK